MTWMLVCTKQAQKDARKLITSGLKPKTQALLALISPPLEKLVGNLTGACSRQINIQHWLVCQVLEGEWVVKTLRLWSYYE